MEHDITKIECPLCGTDVDRRNIETKQSEIPVFKASYDFSGNISTLTKQRTELAVMPCGCNIKLV